MVERRGRVRQTTVGDQVPRGYRGDTHPGKGKKANNFGRSQGLGQGGFRRLAGEGGRRRNSGRQEKTRGGSPEGGIKFWLAARERKGGFIIKYGGDLRGH